MTLELLHVIRDYTIHLQGHTISTIHFQIQLYNHNHVQRCERSVYALTIIHDMEIVYGYVHAGRD